MTDLTVLPHSVLTDSVRRLIETCLHKSPSDILLEELRGVAAPDLQIVPGDGLPFQVEEVPLVWVPSSDNRRLAGRMWLPVPRGGGRQHRGLVAAEILPYRRGDGTAEVDAMVYPYLAGHGIACIRVDSRGCGDSEGTFDDEYSELQQADALAVVDWASSQPWSSGQVLMMGCSWGGFIALQVAMKGHPALAGAVAVCASDRRFEDDMHYQGGCLLSENLSWGAWLMHTVSQPPDPASVGQGRWREQWLGRLGSLEPLAGRWMRHGMADDAYWAVGSSNAAKMAGIAVPLLLVGGSRAGGYINSIPRLAAKGAVGSKVTAVMGPWSHNYPHISPNGPQVGFLQILLAWVRDNVPLTSQLLEAGSDAPSPAPYTFFASLVSGWPSPQPEAVEAGEWLATSSSEDAAALAPASTLPLLPGGILGAPGEANQAGKVPVTGSCRAAASALAAGKDSEALPVGVHGGAWFTLGNSPDLPSDQAPDDSRSTCFDGEPLAEDLLLLGSPKCRLQLDGRPSKGHVAVRLCAVSSGGASVLLSHGFQDLAAAPPDGTVGVQLVHAAFIVPAGYSLRVAVSADCWPMVVPLTAADTIILDLARSSMELRCGPSRSKAVDEARKAVKLPAAVQLPQPLATTVLRSGANTREVRPSSPMQASNRRPLP